MNNRVKKIIREEIYKVLNETRNDKGQYNGRTVNGKDEYVDLHGDKETNSSRGEFKKIISSDGTNLAGLAREMNKLNPSMHMDSSRLVKIRDNKPGYTSGHFHLDKDTADTGLRAASELGLN